MKVKASTFSPPHSLAIACAGEGSQVALPWLRQLSLFRILNKIKDCCLFFCASCAIDSIRSLMKARGSCNDGIVQEEKVVLEKDAMLSLHHMFCSFPILGE